MQDFIKSVTEKLGIDESVATNVTSNSMSWLKDNVGGETFSKMAANMDGAEAMAETGSSEIEGGDSGGGLMGSISDMASNLMGGGDEGGIMGLIGKSGLSMDKISEYAQMLIKYIKEKCGDQVLNQIAEKVPMLKSFIG